MRYKLDIARAHIHQSAKRSERKMIPCHRLSSLSATLLVCAPRYDILFRPPFIFQKYHITFVICQCNLNGSFIQSNKILNPCTKSGLQSYPASALPWDRTRARPAPSPIPITIDAICLVCARIYTQALHSSYFESRTKRYLGRSWSLHDMCMRSAWCLFHTHPQI